MGIFYSCFQQCVYFTQKKSSKLFFGLFALLFFGMGNVGWGQATVPVSRTTWGTTPTGWTDNGTPRTTTYACSGSNGGSLLNSGDYYKVFFLGFPDKVSFSLKATNTAIIDFRVQESKDGSSWTDVAKYTSLAAICTPITLQLLSNSKYVQFIYITKPSGTNVDIDDVSITLFSGKISNTALGDWNDANTWLPVGIPANTDAVIIRSTDIVYTGTSLTRSASTTVNGGFQINAGGYASGTNFTYAAIGSSLIFNNSGSQYGINATEVYWPSSNSPFNVTIQGSGANLYSGNRTIAGSLNINSTFDNNGNITSNGTTFLGAVLNNNGSININGNLQINSGNFNNKSPIYGSSSSLVYNTNYGPFLEWTGNSTTAGTGVPQNVTILNSSTISMPTGNRGMAGNLNITSGTLNLNGGSGDLYIAGNWIKGGSGNFNANTRQVTFNGTTPQTLTGATTFDYFQINNNAGLTISNDVIINNRADLTLGNITLGNNNLALSTGASIINAGPTSYVVTNGTGKLTRNQVGNTATLFPIGFTTSSYTPLTISNTGTVNNISAAVKNSITNTVADATKMVNLEWNVLSAGAGAKVNINYQWNTSDQGSSYSSASLSQVGNFQSSYNFVGSGTPAGSNPFNLSATGLVLPTVSPNLYVIGNQCSIILPPNPTGTISGATPLCNNTTLTFSPPNVQWFWQNVSNGTDNTKPTTTPLNVTATGSYFVTAYDGTCWSSGQVGPYAVTINTPPAITTQPSSTTITAPGTANFNVLAAGTGLIYKWQLNIAGTWTDLPNSAPYSGVGLPTLTITPTNTTLDDNEYRCMISGTCTPSLISNSAILSVDPGPCATETFTNLPITGTSYSNFSWTGDMFTGWIGIKIRSDIPLNSYAATIAQDGTGKLLSPVIPGGCGILTFNYQQAFSSALNANVYVNSTLVGTISGSSSGPQTFNATVNITGNVQISIQQVNGSSGQITIDDLAWSCYSVCTSTANVTSFLPASGPVGTRVRITGTGFTGATAVKIGGVAASSFNIVNDNTIIAQVGLGTTVGKVSVTAGGCKAFSPSEFSIIYENGNCGLSGSGSTVTDLSISEVYDADKGTLAYIEVFNGTSASIDMTAGNYKVRVTTGTSTNNDYALTGSLASGATYLVQIGSGITCSGVTPSIIYSSAQGFNGNDRIYLLKGGTPIDYVPNPNYGGGKAPGFSQLRKAITTAPNIPSMTYTPGDWTISDNEDCSNLGIAPYKVGGSTVTISTQPSDVGCNTSITLTVAASSSPTNTLTYVWKFNNPASMSGWDNVSYLPNSPYNYPVTIAGTGSNSITITGNTAILQNFQFYALVGSVGSPVCTQSSNVAQYNFNSLPFYKSIKDGNWNDVTTWNMSNDGTTYIAACNYPIAATSTKVIIDNVVTLPINVDANNVVINSGDTLTIGTSGKLTMNNGTTGADLVVNGILNDRGSSGNGIDYNTGATWSLDALGTVVKTYTSSAAKYRDNYEGNISNIPASAKWYYRYNGDGAPTVVSANMYYPNLYFENTNNIGTADLNSGFSPLSGSSPMVVKGDLNIGTTGTGSVKIYNNIINVGNNIVVNGSLNIGASSTLTNQTIPVNTTGTGFEIKKDISNNGTLVLNSAGWGTLKTSGNLSQTISGSGHFYLYDVNIANTGSANTVLTTTIDQIDHQLYLTSGNLDVQSNGVINMSDGSSITAASGDFANSASWGKIYFRGGAGAFSGNINFYPDVYITPPSILGGVNFGGTSILHHLLEIDANGYVDKNAPTYVSSSLLRYNTNGDFSRSVEWSQPSGNGSPYNVQVSGTNTILNPAQSSGGFASTAFNTAGDVTIDDGSSIYMDYTGKNMIVPLIVGGNLLINGNISASKTAPGDIKVNGNWTRSSTGVFNPNNRAVFFIGSGNSVISAPLRETFDYLFLEKNSSSNVLNLSDSIIVTQQFGIAKGTLTLNNKDVTLTSDNNATASMNAMDANAILNYNGSGRFRVERFIPDHTKAWQFLSVPTKGSTINEAWQEGSLIAKDNLKPGYGTTISSPTGSGFDMTSVSPSMKTYNTSGDNFIGVAGTNIPIDNPSGYFLFVRGDRSVTGVNQTATSTTLRTRGKLYAPTPGGEAPSTITINKNGYTSVGNPYASSIDYYSLTRNGFDNGTYYIFDPQLTSGPTSSYGYGGYRTISLGSVVPEGGNYINTNIPPIQSGQAFFVYNPNPANGSIAFTESAKTDGSRSIFRASGRDGDFTQPDAQLRGNLYVNYNNEYILIDGELTQFQPSYDAGLDGLDARKLMNTGENMGIISHNTELAIERRPLPLVTDTLFYQLTNMKEKPYRFEFIASKMDISGLEGYVYDQYLKTETTLNMSDTTYIDFNVTSDANSAAANRFMIYFKPAAGPLPVTFTNVNAHLQNKDVIVEWKTENEKDMNGYTLQASLDGTNFKQVTFIKATNNGVGNYAYTDADAVPGYHYYRVQSVDANGKTALTSIVKVWVGSGKHLITIYPNPIRNNEVNLQFEGQVQGEYKARLLNSLGQVLASKEINFAGGSGNETIQLGQYTAHGVYHLEITQPDGKKVVLKVMK